MCFNRKKIRALQESVNALQATVNELNNTIVTQELTRLRNESKNFAEVRGYLHNLKFKLKNIKFIDNGETNPHLEINYEIPQVNVYFDNDKKVIKNPLFMAINQLELLSLKDYEKISKEINNAKDKL